MTNNPVTPKEVYDSYPASDLIAVDPPGVGETFHDYINRQGRRNLLACGDTLFAFLLFELTEADTREDAVRMLNRAIDDIAAVLTHIQNQGE